MKASSSPIRWRAMGEDTERIEKLSERIQSAKEYL